MNWGYKILLVYLIFILGILFMVFKSSTQKTDLVTTDYYAKELKYQEKIDEMKQVVAQLLDEEDSVKIYYLCEACKKKINSYGEAGVTEDPAVYIV